MALNLIWDLSVIWINSLAGLHSGKPANLRQPCIAVWQNYTENEKSNEISILCIQTGLGCLNGLQTLGVNHSRPRLQQSTQTHRKKIAKMHRSISSFVVEDWNISVSMGWLWQAFARMPKRWVSFPGNGEELICVKWITLQVSPALISGDGGRFWWLLLRGRRLLTPKLFLHNTGMQCKIYLLMFVTTKLLHSKITPTRLAAWTNSSHTFPSQRHFYCKF